jgi:hypothetical protein
MAATTSPKKIFSKNWAFAGTGTGAEQIALSIPPWETSAITIVGAEIAVISGTPVYTKVVNNYLPNSDVMVIGGPSEFHVLNMFPSNSGFAFPGTDNLLSTTPVIKTVVNFGNASNFSLVMNLYYSIP